jgi:class 3 adenylate cyclase/tetratricopeptide (TPR) repeat protein
MPVDKLTPEPLPEVSPSLIEHIKTFVHPSITQRLQAGQLRFINEHRKVAILFAGFSGFDYDNDPAVTEKLQHYLSQVIQIVERYDGYLNKVDMGDKGSKCLILFGAPIAHENDVERALRCALELRAIPETPLRIGVSAGFVFAGQVGSALRQEYTVMGDAVNLAARLMQAAHPGQVLVQESVTQSGRGVFLWEGSASLQVKGKSDPVVVNTLLGTARRGGLSLQEPQYTLPMVGRQKELQTVRTGLNRVLLGQGQILSIIAEAGMGKSRLVAEVIRLANERNLASFGGECLSHGANASYLVWQPLLRGFFGIDASQPLQASISHLEQELAAINPDLLPRLPLLGLALNLPIPDNDLTHALSARLRKESLEGLIVECIRRRAEQTPLLLVFEDCHWIDPLSNDCLEIVARNIADLPVLIVAAFRPPESERSALHITRFGHYTEIHLSEFTMEEAERLISLKLARFTGGLGSVSVELVERIMARAQGNPFYIDEMINLVHDRGIDLTNLDALHSLELPDSLHSLIISRIDRLNEATKTTLKVASVIGRTFQAGWLWMIYPSLGAPAKVLAQLQQLSRLDITPQDKPEPELEYIFKHIVTREVAYESISVATRRSLHQEAGQFIETQYADSLDRYIDLLAYHFGLSDDRQKQRRYFRKAGDAARAAYANQAAVDYYQRLIPLLEDLDQVDVLLSLGEVWRLTGRWNEAESLFRAALEITQRFSAPGLQARCHRALGGMLLSKGAYELALDQLLRAQRMFREITHPQGYHETLLEIGVIYWSQGDFPKALGYFRQCEQLASELGDQRGVYRAIGNQGLVYKAQGDYERALQCYQQCLTITRQIGDRQNFAKISGNIGNVYLEQGHYAQALAYFIQNLQVAQEIGDRQGTSVSVGNIGNVYDKQGYYQEALMCYLKDQQISLELGDRKGAGFAAWNLGLAYASLNESLHARKFLEGAIQLGRSLDTRYELCDYLGSLAALYTHIHEFAAAKTLTEEALSLAQELEHENTFHLQVLRTRLALYSGEIDLSQGIASLEQLETSYRDGRQDENEQAIVHYEIWRLDRSLESHRRAAADLYRKLYLQTPDIQSRQRFEELTGDRLGETPALPELPDIVTRNAPDPDVLLAQLHAMIQEA